MRWLYMEKEVMIRLSLRVPPSLKQLAEKFVELDAHKDISDLIRDALREKIRREAPNLYSDLFKDTENNEQKNEGGEPEQ